MAANDHKRTRDESEPVEPQTTPCTTDEPPAKRARLEDEEPVPYLFQAIIELALPFVIEVSTAPVVFSLTALDSLLTPKYLDSFLRDLVDARGPENQVRLEKELEKSEACEKS